MTTFYTVGRGTKFPDYAVEIDFTNAPTNPARVWTDVGPDVRRLSFARAGRNHELQRTEPGSMAGILNNRHGRYDSTWSGSPYFPNVKRMRWMRVLARWSGVTYTRWTGLVESWVQVWPGFGRDATVEIRGTDAMKVLSLYDLAGKSYGAQRTDQRVSAVCADAGLPVTVETGASSVVAAGPFSEGSSAFSHLQDVEETENGLLFAEADGSITFQNRHHRLLSSGTILGTIGDAAGEIPYRDARFALDDGDLWNIASVTPSGGGAQTSSDATSITNHFARRLNRALLTSSSAEAASAAEYLVARYADPAPRVPTVELVGAKDTTKWPTILAAKNSDRFTWKRRAAAHTISTQVFAEQFADDLTPEAWVVAAQLSPADDQSGWVLGDATYGVLGSTTRLVY